MSLMPMIDVYATVGTFNEKQKLARDLAQVAVGRLPRLVRIVPSDLVRDVLVWEPIGSLREVPSRFDRESEQFHRTLREAFLSLASAHPERIKVIDAAQSVQRVHEQVVGLVEKLLQN